jgi:isopropylmalate/homocitrate/citramalate synthase
MSDDNRLYLFDTTSRDGQQTRGVDFTVAGKAACLAGKTWGFHVDAALEIDRDESIWMISDNVIPSAKRGFEPMFDREQYFDGFKGNPDDALARANEAYEASVPPHEIAETAAGGATTGSV